MKILLVVFFLGCANLSAQTSGNFNGREIADVVFRDLDNAPNVHSAIYIGQTDKKGVGTGDAFYYLTI